MIEKLAYLATGFVFAILLIRAAHRAGMYDMVQVLIGQSEVIM